MPVGIAVASTLASVVTIQESADATVVSVCVGLCRLTSLLLRTTSIPTCTSTNIAVANAEAGVGRIACRYYVQLSSRGVRQRRTGGCSSRARSGGHAGRPRTRIVRERHAVGYVRQRGRWRAQGR